MKRLKIVDNKGRVYPLVEDGRMNYVRYPVQKTNGKWVCAQVLAGGGYLSVEQDRVHTEYDSFQDAQKSCDRLNVYYGYNDAFVEMIVSVSMKNSMTQEAFRNGSVSITPSEYAGLACDMMFRIMQDNGAVNRTENERYPAEHVNAIAITAEIFFAANGKYLNPEDVDNICCGHADGRRKKYLKKKGWAGLDKALNNYFDVL